jgi:hypothetical protein
VVDVEGEADGDSAPGDVRDRAGDKPRGRLLQVEVVEGEVERSLGSGDELADVLGDLEGALTPVGQSAGVDGQAYPRTLR